MKKIFTLLLAVAFTTFANAQKMDQAEMMRAWQAYMTPGDIHKMLAKSNGLWKTESSMWMDAASEPVKSTGTCMNRMVLGGRYQQSNFKGSFMGQSFEGQGTVAYDNARKKFISNWIDNMGSGIMTMDGTWDDASRSINFSGLSTDPMTGKEVPVREVFTIVDDNHQHMEMFMNDMSGKEFKTMDIIFTRMPGKKS